MKRNLFAGCGLALLLTACLSGTDEPDADNEVVRGPAFAPAATLQQMLIGKTTFGNAMENGAFRNAFCDYYGPDGAISSVEIIGDGREARAGTYTIEDGTVCVAYPQSGGDESCQQVVARQSSTAPSVWGGDFYGPEGTILSTIVTAEGNQLERCR